MKTVLNMTLLSLSLFASTAMADVYAVVVHKISANGMELVANCLTKDNTTSDEEIAGVGQLSIRVNDRVAVEAHQTDYSGILNLSVGEKSKEAVNMEVDDRISLVVANVAIGMERIKNAAAAPKLKICQR